MPEADTHTSDRRTRASLMPLFLVVGLAIVLIATWRLYAHREYWAAAWRQGTLSPQIIAGANTAASSGTLDLSNPVIPTDEIHRGGPEKDGIPAISNPLMIDAADAAYLRPNDRIIGVAVDSRPRAYPLRILNHHEVVNDRAGNLPIAVTYCPLCDSAMVFDRRTPLGEREFGVSGRLFNSNVLMYDRGASRESLWSQVMCQGVTGPAAGRQLKTLPVELTTWERWRDRHPNTLVQSIRTGHQRDYQQNPYAGYFAQQGLMFPAHPHSDKLPAKSPVLGVWTENADRAYPIAIMGPDPKQFDDVLDGKSITLEFEPPNNLRVVRSDDGVQWIYAFWFAWYAMRPDTTVFSMDPADSSDAITVD